MTLAQQLDELASAYSRGLLNDDEYRILRQDLFERYSHNALLPAERPVLPVTSSGRKGSLPSASFHARVDDAQPDNHKPRMHQRNPLSPGLPNFIKRTKAQTPSSSSAIRDPPRPSTAPGGTSNRGVKPLLRKASEFFFSHMDSKRHVNPSVSSPRVSPLLPDARHPTNTPWRSPKRIAIPTFSSNQVQVPKDVFDDKNLYTAKEIRAAIIATEAEAKRLMDTFNGLETTTAFRVRQQNARRLPSATPEHVNALMDGTDWRNHRPIPPPSPSQYNYSDRKGYQHVPNGIVITNDGASMRSDTSSIRTSLSRSKSISSLRSKQYPASPLSARFPMRKNSVSSISSQTHSTRRLATPGASASLSRSTGHLPLSMLVEGDDSQGNFTEPSPEVTEIQRHREDVMARYTARVDFLQAKLNSAERHEKLLKGR